jgi:hypothetical protein
MKGIDYIFKNKISKFTYFSEKYIMEKWKIEIEGGLGSLRY